MIASIHQPSTSTFQLFDKLLLLSAGKPHYFGSVSGIGPYYESLGFPVPLHMNPAEFILELMNIDFASHQKNARHWLEQMQDAWSASDLAALTASKISHIAAAPHKTTALSPRVSRANFLTATIVLVHRSFIKSYRDVVAYGIRIAMYTGLAIMMGTVWLRLKSDQTDIQPFINAIVSHETL